MDSENKPNSTTNDESRAAEQEKKELVDFVGQNIEAIVAMHMRAEQRAGAHQRLIEKVTTKLGRPRFFYLILCFVTFWVSVNLVLASFHLPNFDSPPFPWLQGIIGLSALAMTTVILITQNRQSWLAEQRMHLNIQINLLIEQKVTKLIDLVEELRRDIPTVQDRHDPKAEAMKKTVDPHEVISNLNQTLEEAKTLFQ